MNTTRRFPATRLRRIRQKPFLRHLTSETVLTRDDLIYPMFIMDGNIKRDPIPSLPTIDRVNVDELLREAEEIAELGIPAIALFPSLPNIEKDNAAKQAYADDGLIQTAIRQLKQRFPELGVITDIALDTYTDHGQDGLLDDSGNVILNDETNAVLAKQALSHARAGVDIIAPSDMMDGRIHIIRQALDENGFQDVCILSYAAKYASNFYSPFRQAVQSAKGKVEADKRTYQMNFANSDEALHEVAMDLEEGADMVMVKPGLPYLDVIQRVKETFQVPTFSYQVTGEFTMLQTAIEQGFLNEACVYETLLSLKRAGSDAILSYFAKQIAPKLPTTCN